MTNRDRLIEKHMIRAKIIAGVYKRDHCTVEFDDIYQDACVGLCKAADNFDALRGIQFGTYADRVIRGRILDGRRDCNILKRGELKAVRNGELNVAFQSMGDLSMNELPRVAACQLDDVAQKEFAALISQLIDSLPKRLRLVLRLYYYDELTMWEIGKILGVIECRISQMHSLAIKMLRHNYIKYLQQQSATNGLNALLTTDRGSSFWPNGGPFRQIRNHSGGRNVGMYV